MQRFTLDDARQELRRRFGYDDFRPPQRSAIATVLSRRDAIIVLPTGGGKSVCFQVPALLFPGLTIVVSPLISLMADQVQALQARGIAAEYLNSTLTPDETARRTARLRGGELKLLYVAPERLVIGPTTRLLQRLTVAMLAVDEAHCVSEWGQDFRPSYLRLADVRRLLGRPQTVALTATATPRVRHDIGRLLELDAPCQVVGGFDRPNIAMRVARVRNEAARREALIGALEATTDPVVVYASTRRLVDATARLISGHRVRAVAYHAGLPAERRAQAQEAFMSGRSRVIVATNAFGMGIDKPDVRLVVHVTMSGSLEDYYQEAGRAGRDGGPSRSLLLFHPADRGVHDRMRAAGHPTPELVRRVWNALGRTGGTGPVSLDPLAVRRLLLRRPPEADRVRAALAFLLDHALLRPLDAELGRRVRLLALPFRIEIERSSLSREGRQLLAALEPLVPDETWHSVRPAALDLPPYALERAVQELESRQLAYAEPLRAEGTLAPDGARRLEPALRHLARRRAADRAKLDAMVGYATTTSCRRGFILRYFGDDTARTSCASCDNCEA